MARNEHKVEGDWRSPDGINNARAVRATYAAALSAVAQIDGLGHRILTRAIGAGPANGVDRVVGLALLRRSVTAFVGVRHLLEASSAQPALIVTRSQFEIYLAIRYLVHGGKPQVSLETPTHRRQRETRARYYMAASIRTGIYRRQAVLDGAEGAMRATDRRAELEAEIEQEREQLQRYFAVQHRRFGRLVCYPAGNAAPRYHDRDAWFSFGFRSGRVNSIKALADRMGLLGSYFLLYSPLSDLGHARETDYDLTIQDRQAAVHSPYDPTFLPVALYWATTWHLLALAHATKAYCPDAHTDIQRTERAVRDALDDIGDETTALVL